MTQSGPTTPTTPSTEPRSKAPGLAIAALILGGVGTLFGLATLTSIFTYQLFFITAIIAVIAVGLGTAAVVLARRRQQGTALAWGGLSAAIAAAAMAVIGGVMFASLMAAFDDADDVFADDEIAQVDDLEDSQDEPEHATAAVGEAVTSGILDVTVTEFEPGIESIGDADFDKKPHGQYIFVHLDITNTGDVPEYFYSESISLVDEDGKRHNADDEAEVYLDEDVVLYEEINPGNTHQGIAVFDVPADVIPRAIAISDDFWE